MGHQNAQGPDAVFRPTDVQLAAIARQVRATYDLPDLTMPPEVERFLEATPTPHTGGDPDESRDVRSIEDRRDQLLATLDALDPAEASRPVLGQSRRGLDAVTRVLAAETYVADVLAEAPRIVERNGRNADAVREAWRSTAAPPESLVAYAEKVSLAAASLRGRLDELESRQAAERAARGSDDASPEHLDRRLGLETEIMAVKVALMEAQQLDDHLGTLSSIADFEVASAEFLQMSWSALAAMSSRIQQRRQKRRTRRRQLRSLTLVVYAVLLVLLGVGVDVVLGKTLIAGVLTSAVAAVTLWATDRWVIAPRVDRYVSGKDIGDLEDAVTSSSNFLVSVRHVQAIMHPMARTYGAELQDVIGRHMLDGPA